MGETWQRELNVAIEAVREATALCRAVQEQLRPDVLGKKDRSPVTVADFGSQALVCRALAEAFPDDPVIAEEDSAELREARHASLLDQVVRRVAALRPGAGADEVCRWIDHGGAGEHSPRFWTLDPIDGTKGFLRREQYAIALALIVEGRLTVAALACPNLAADGADLSGGGAIFTAVRGGGAHIRPIEADGRGRPVRVSSTTEPAEARFCESVEAGHSSHGDAAAIAEALGIRSAPVRMDSQAKYAVVARGGADIYLRLPTRGGYVEKIWDHAAGALVVEEAGGRVTDIAGRPLEFHHGPRLEANRGVVVSNGRLHERVLEAVGRVGVA